MTEISITGGRVVLLGQHIGYSASPAIQNAAFDAYRLALRYELLDVAPDALPAAIEQLRREAGANVTQPHKIAAMALVDDLSTDAERAGALNTIVPDDGRLIGYNTDLPAIAEELVEVAPDARRAVVLGAGGASRATVVALADAGASATVITRARWADLAEELCDADLLVNATPIGTASDVSPVPANLLRPELAVMDLVYRPSPTRLVRDARNAGAPASDGRGVLLRQAALSFTLWTGRDAPLGPMRSALERELAHA
jgi:shikimate dehydrogenase